MKHRVLRGGAYYTHARQRGGGTSDRARSEPEARLEGDGFRVVIKRRKP